MADEKCKCVIVLPTWTSGLTTCYTCGLPINEEVEPAAAAGGQDPEDNQLLSTRPCDWPFESCCDQKEACMKANRCLKNLPGLSGVKLACQFTCTEFHVDPRCSSHRAPEPSAPKVELPFGTSLHDFWCDAPKSMGPCNCHLSKPKPEPVAGTQVEPRCEECQVTYSREDAFMHTNHKRERAAGTASAPRQKEIEFWREHANGDASPDWSKFSADTRRKLDSISVEIISCAFAAEEMCGELFDAKYLERNVRWNRAMVMITELLIAAPAVASCKGCESKAEDYFEHDGCIVEKAVSKEQGRWQQAIYELCRKHAIAPDCIDGGGTDSGDPLDFTLSEIGQVICQLENPQDYGPSAAPSVAGTPAVARCPKCGSCELDFGFKWFTPHVKCVLCGADIGINNPLLDFAQFFPSQPLRTPPSPELLPLIREYVEAVRAANPDEDRCNAAWEALENVCELERHLHSAAQPGLSPLQEKLMNNAQKAPYFAERRCCTVCDAKKLCTICGAQTDMACSDCRIDFQSTIYVCSKNECRNEHEGKCSARLLEKLAKYEASHEVHPPRESEK